MRINPMHVQAVLMGLGIAIFIAAAITLGLAVFVALVKLVLLGVL